jgi:leader peptidase (prepilin peptidase)/N-methyltransferase
MHLDTAAACAVIGLVSGWFVPQLVARIPEPAPPPEPKPGAKPKIPYAELAAAPGLAWKSALASALTAGVAGLELGWAWPLTMWVFLAPVGVALAYIDYRTWLLPTRIIWPSLAVVLALGLVGAVVDASYHDVLRGLIGSALAFLMFGFLWALPGGGMGYGDVRLSTVLGFVLGYLGWSELMFGLWTGFLLGSVGWIPLRLLRFTKTRHFPFGPFMLLGALVGVVWGADMAAHLAAFSERLAA